MVLGIYSILLSGAMLLATTGAETRFLGALPDGLTV